MSIRRINRTEAESKQGTASAKSERFRALLECAREYK
jgi:hypothetical protein